MLKFLSGLFDSNEKQLKKIQPLIDQINSLEAKYEKYTDEELKNVTTELRKTFNINSAQDIVDLRNSYSNFVDVTKLSREKAIADERETLEKILPDAFAVAREASKRVANHRHFDVQVMAGYFLFSNKVVELFTGEGKTLAANLPLYLYALTGKGAHLVTVNDYLARRDAEWNGHILNSLGISVAAINNETQYRFITDEEAVKLKGNEAKELIKKRDELVKTTGRLKYDHMTGVNLIECTKNEAYACDVVYGTNNEFGFDYLRDNMARSIDDRVQGPLHYAIVDEADSILIDEARTPLIISQSADESNEMYSQFATIVDKLTNVEDYTVDEKTHSVVLLEKGIDKLEKLLNVKNVYENAQFAYHIDNALKAKELYHLDEEYIVREGEVLIVDEFTGRVLAGRRYSEGLHQAIEAKEGVEVKRESKTLATITLQNYFRLYDFAAGMTGTALTEAEEFANIYKLDVIVIPTNKPVVREDKPDVVYRTQLGKFKAIIEDIKAHFEKGQPVLVGTTSVEKSEILSEMLSKEGINHNVLNAKNHERESKIVAEAGKKGMITIATNMAGRGTDIALGEGVKELGGLYIIGSERHESRRIDNQLRGRSGRQGDPGQSQFYVSFEDDLMRIFGGTDLGMLMGRVGMDDTMPISSSILGRTIESAQKRVEAYNYDIRKHLVEYDDVLNQQREIIYELRRKILSIIKKQESEFAEKKDTNNYSAKDFSNYDINRILDELEGFNIKDPSTYANSGLGQYAFANRPLNIFILKKVVDYVRFLVASQLADDMKIDNSEERKTVSQMQSFLSEDLLDVSSKILGYKDQVDFFKAFDAESNLAKKEEMLLKVTMSGFLFHVHAVGQDAMTELGRLLILQTIDYYWMEHLDTMTDLKEGINLRDLAQRDPLVEYKNEGFRLFDQLLGNIDNGIVSRFFKIRVARENNQPLTSAKEVKQDAGSPFKDKSRVVDAKVETSQEGGHKTVKRMRKIGRNDPCPCGSGKKYKKCCYPKFGE